MRARKPSGKRSDKPEWFAWSETNLADSRRLETIALIFKHDERLLSRLFDFQSPRLRAPAAQLIANNADLNPSELLLIRCAIDIWNGEGHANLSEILRHWDGEVLVRLVRALCHLKEIRNEVMHALIDDENGGFCL